MNYLDKTGLTQVWNNLKPKIKTTITTEEAEEHTIEEVAPVNGKIDVSGNSTQETRSGKNLYNKYGNLNYPSSGFNQNKTTLQSDGTLKTTANWSSWGSTGYRLTDIKPNTNYAISGKLISSTGSGHSVIAIALVYALQDTTWNAICRADITNTGNFLVGFNSGEYSDYFVSLNANGTYGTSCEAIFDEVMLRDSSTTADYEPYGVMPSPDYPSEIHNVGDNVNLFNITTTPTWRGSDTTSSVEGNTLKVSGQWYVGIPISVKANTTYYVSAIRSNLTGSSSAGNITIFTGAYGQSIKSLGRDNGSFNSGDRTSVSIVFYSGTGTSGTADFSNIKIEEGTQATSYSPYNCGSAGIQVSNKNLFDGELELGIIDWNTGNNSANSSRIRSKNYIPVDGNKKYIFSWENTNLTELVIYQYKENYEYYQTDAVKVRPNGIYTPTRKDTKYIRFMNNTNLSDTTIKIQIEEGSTATEYIEHQEQLITIPFTEGQRLMLGDYLANDGIHHVTGKLVFDGTEDWQLLETSSAKFSLAISNLKRNNNLKSVISNYYTGVSYSETWSAYDYFIVANSTVDAEPKIRINHKNISTLEDFKLYLAQQYSNGTPIIVEYKLAEEIVEPYTEEQEEAYWKLQHTLMYEDYTKIECIDETKAEFVVTYSYNNEINTTYGKKIDSLEYKIHQLENAVNNLSQ